MLRFAFMSFRVRISYFILQKFMRKLGCFIVIDLFLCRTVVAIVLNPGDDALVFLLLE